MALLLSSPSLSFSAKLFSNSSTMPPKFHRTSITVSSSSASSSTTVTEKRKLPILLFDIMDTIVRDPFYHDVPAFFRMSLKELIECKHPTAWIEFEQGLINEAELAMKFFKDARAFDLEGLKNCMKKGYSYLEGVKELLEALKRDNYEMHAFTNYPIWYELIEEKLKLSAYLSWTFCSCATGKRKPEPDSYIEVLKHLKVEPASCVFIDDRIGNVEAAIDVGITGLHFKNVASLSQDLSLLGIDISMNKQNESQDLDELATEYLP